MCSTKEPKVRRGTSATTKSGSRAILAFTMRVSVLSIVDVGGLRVSVGAAVVDARDGRPSVVPLDAADLQADRAVRRAVVVVVDEVVRRSVLDHVLPTRAYLVAVALEHDGSPTIEQRDAVA